MKIKSSIISILFLIVISSCTNDISFNEKELNIWEYLDSDTQLQCMIEEEYLNDKINIISDSSKIIQLSKIRIELDNLLDTISKIRRNIINRTGKYISEQPSIYTGANNDISYLMLKSDSINSNLGNNLKENLDIYYNNIKNISGLDITYYPIALDAKDDICIYQTVDKQKDFSTYHFKGVPMIVVMAKISQLELKAIRYSSHAIDYILMNNEDIIKE